MAEHRETAGKERVALTLSIAGRRLSVVTEESEEEARRIERIVDERLRAMAKANPRFGTLDGRLDAALLVAVDAVGEAEAAARRIRKLEAELRRTRQTMADTKADTRSPAPDLRYAGLTREEKLGRIRALLEAEKSGVREANT